jgi:hypothetical protein
MSSDVFTVARYKIDEVVWWVNFVAKDEPSTIAEQDEWIKNHHPKVLFDRGYFKPLWKTTAALPRLEKVDFLSVMHILTCEIVVSEFVVSSIARSHDTGEFFYSNMFAEWMPESFLFDSREAAGKEKKRITSMIRKWCDS